MKQGWEIKPLGQIADVEYGFTDKSTEEGDYRYVRITDIDNNGKLISTEKRYLTHSKEAKGFLLQDNDLLMARTGATFAKVLLYEDIEPSVFASYLIRIKFKEKFENKLYWYYSKSKSYWDQANSLASGAAQPHFNGAAVKQVIFSFPKSLHEQQRIVSILDKAFAAIDKAKANAEQNLKNAKELFESYLQGVFEKKGDGWEEKTLGELAFVKSGGTPLRHKTEYWSGNIAWYSSGELNNLYTTNPERHINELAIENSNAKLFPKGSLLIGMYDTAALKMSILDRDGTFNQAIAGVKPNQKIDLIFILHAINAIKPEILNLRRGVRQKNLSLEKIKNITIALPPLKAQQTIVRQLDALRAETQKLEAVYQKKMDDLEELKKSILQRAFAGELGTSPITDTTYLNLKDPLKIAAEPSAKYQNQK